MSDQSVIALTKEDISSNYTGQYGKSYNAAKEIFKRFADILADNSPRYTYGATFEFESEAITINFFDRKLLLHLTVKKIEGNNRLCGVISCYAFDQVNTEEKSLISTITFEEFGYTINLVDDNQRPFSLTYNEHALLVLRYCINKALSF